MPATAAATTDTIPPGRFVPPGAYRPQADTGLPADAFGREELEPGTDVLDSDTGTGALALLAASRGARVTAGDVSWGRAGLSAEVTQRASVAWGIPWRPALCARRARLEQHGIVDEGETREELVIVRAESR